MKKITMIVLVVLFGIFFSACSENEEKTSVAPPTYFQAGDGNEMAAKMVDLELQNPSDGSKSNIITSKSLTYKEDGVGGYGVITVACADNPGVGPVETNALLSFVVQSPNQENGLWEITSPPDEASGDESAEEAAIIDKLEDELSDTIDPLCKEK